MFTNTASNKILSSKRAQRLDNHETINLIVFIRLLVLLFWLSFFFFYLFHHSHHSLEFSLSLNIKNDCDYISLKCTQAESFSFIIENGTTGFLKGRGDGIRSLFLSV